MISKILLPLDGSHLAEMSLPHAITMARATGSSLVLLQVIQPKIHVYGPSAMWGIPGMLGPELTEDLDEERGQAQAYLSSIEGKLKAEGVDAVSRVVDGDPALVILSEARQDPSITLIAMSTHGRSGLGRWFFGSVAEKLLHSAAVPLLLIHPDENHGPEQHSYAGAYRTIMVPLDGSVLAEQALQKALPLVDVTGSTLVLTLATPRLTGMGMSMYWEATGIQLYADAWHAESLRLKSYLSRTADALHMSGIKVRTHIVEGNPSEAITQAVEHVQPELIVMSTHGAGSEDGLPELLLGSVALKVVHDVGRPVLLVPVKDAHNPQVRLGAPNRASVQKLGAQ